MTQSIFKVFMAQGRWNRLWISLLLCDPHFEYKAEWAHNKVCNVEGGESILINISLLEKKMSVVQRHTKLHNRLEMSVEDEVHGEESLFKEEKVKTAWHCNMKRRDATKSGSVKIQQMWHKLAQSLSHVSWNASVFELRMDSLYAEK